MTIFWYTKYGDGLYFVPHLIYHGANTYTFIEDKWYKHLYDGMIPKYESLTVWKSKIKKGDIVIFDYNTKLGVETYLELTKRGIDCIGGSPFQKTLEDNRAFTMKLFANAGILIPDTYIMKNNKSGIDFAKKNEGKWVYKPNGDTASDETYMAQSGKDLIDWIQSREDQEFILQKFVPDAVAELGVSLYFSKGKPIMNPAHCIELKRYGSGDMSKNVGCMSSVSWYDVSMNNPTMEATWNKLLSIFEKEKFTGQCDISGIVNKSGDFYALEATPGRFGYSQDLTFKYLWRQNIVTVMYAMATGDKIKLEADTSQYSFKARASIDPYPVEIKKGFEEAAKQLIHETRDTPVEYKSHEGITYDWVDVKKGKITDMQTAGCDAIICEVGCVGKDIMRAQEDVVSAIKDIKMNSIYTRIDCFEGAEKNIIDLKKLGFWGGI